MFRELGSPSPANTSQNRPLSKTHHTCSIISNIFFLLFQKASPFVLEQIDFIPPESCTYTSCPGRPAYELRGQSNIRHPVDLVLFLTADFEVLQLGCGHFSSKKAARSAGKSPSARAAYSLLWIFFPQIFQQSEHLLIVQISDDVSDRS